MNIDECDDVGMERYSEKREEEVERDVRVGGESKVGVDRTKLIYYRIYLGGVSIKD